MKTMLITGASGGIGAATALLAAKNNYAVAVNYHKNKDAADELVENIKANGGLAAAIKADVSDEEQVKYLFSETNRLLGNLICLINNAGILHKQTSLHNMDVTRLLQVFSTNTIGTFLCSREAIKKMSFRNGGNGGSIVNVSSMAAKTGSPNEYIDYAASKAAIDAMTVGLAKEVADDGVRVNAVRPAFIHTNIHANAGNAKRIEHFKKIIPMKRGGFAEEVAEAIIWLASEKASYTTGSFIDVAGGF